MTKKTNFYDYHSRDNMITVIGNLYLLVGVTCVQHLNKLLNREDEICISYCVSQISFRKRFINRIPPASTSGVHLIASIELGDCKTEVDSSLF